MQSWLTSKLLQWNKTAEFSIFDSISLFTIKKFVFDGEEEKSILLIELLIYAYDNCWGIVNLMGNICQMASFHEEWFPLNWKLKRKVQL